MVLVLYSWSYYVAESALATHSVDSAASAETPETRIVCKCGISDGYDHSVLNGQGHLEWIIREMQVPSMEYVKVKP